MALGLFCSTTASVLLGAAPMPAAAKIDSSNPANNYYFPMAKYRYLPRIFRAWIACSELAVPAIEEKNWEGLEIVWERLDDATTAMPLYTNAVEGSRSSKRKKKSPEQREMLERTKKYTSAVATFGRAVKKRDADMARTAVVSAAEELGTYRTLAKIDKEGGGLIDNSEFESKSGSKITGTG